MKPAAVVILALAMSACGAAPADIHRTRMLAAERILDVRPPGATLQSRGSSPGGEAFGEPSANRAEAWYRLTGDTLPAARALTGAAQAEGWTIIGINCFGARDRSFLIDAYKHIEGWWARLELNAGFHSPSPDGPRFILVELTVPAARVDPGLPPQANEVSVEESCLLAKNGG
jgi:hypothetical protein